MHLAVEAVGIELGTSVVTTDFLDEVAGDDRFDMVTVLADPAPRSYDVPDHPKFRVSERRAAKRWMAYRIFWKLFLLGRELRSLGVDVSISLTGQGRSTEPPSVVFIQQPMPYAPEAYRVLSRPMKLRMRMIWMVTRFACRAARRVIVQTPTMAERVTSAYRLPSDRVTHVMPTAPPTPESDMTALGLQPMRDVQAGHRLLYVGSDHRHKNLEGLTAGVAALRRTLPDAVLFMTLPPDHPLVGPDHVVGLGSLTRAEVAGAYEMADAVCLASLTETVGLSQLEAMAFDTPVLTADRPYAHDVCGDAAVFFDPRDPEDFAAKAGDLLTNPDLQTTLIEKGRSRLAALSESSPYSHMLDVTADAVIPSDR